MRMRHILALAVCLTAVGYKNEWPKEANREAVMADAESIEVFHPPPLDHLFVARKSDGSVWLYQTTGDASAKVLNAIEIFQPTQ